MANQPRIFSRAHIAQSNPKVSWILIDCDQGLASGMLVVSESIAAIHSARAANGPSALGGSSNTRREILHALDAGARGMLVPMVGRLLTIARWLTRFSQISTAAQERELVAYVRFPPLGQCEPNSLLTHGSRAAALHYLADANDTVIVMTQIETTEGLANVKEIVEVDGLGGLPAVPTYCGMLID